MRRGKKCARSSHGHTGITRHSPRNGFTVSFVLLAIGLFCHRHLRNCFHRLDTSVEMSGPHDFTVRSKHRPSRAPLRPPHPAPTSVTFAKRPSGWGRTGRVLVLICPTRLGKNSDYGAGVARSVTPASHSAMLGWNVCKTSGIERRAEARPLSRATRAFSAMYATKRSKPRMLSMRVKL